MTNLRRIAFLFCCLGSTLNLSAQQSCYEQYLRENNMPFFTAEDADDSYEEFKKTAIAYERMSEEAAKTRRAAEQPNPATQCAQSEPTFLPILLAIDTLTGTCHLLAEDGTILADAQLALVDSTWYMWLSVDPLADKYPGNTPYLYCNGNPIMLVDPDGRDWLEAEDGTIQWTDCRSQQAMDQAKIAGRYLGKAVLDFQGARYEQLGWKNGKFGFLDGQGALPADVTMYCQDGTIVRNMVGFTMSSDFSTFGAIAEGWYNADFDSKGKSGKLTSHWKLTSEGAPTGQCKEIDGNPNFSPAAKNDWNYGTPWKIGEYIHATNANGYAGPTNYNHANGMRPGAGISVGCLLLLPKDFKILNNAMDNLSTFKVRVTR